MRQRSTFFDLPLWMRYAVLLLLLLAALIIRGAVGSFGGG